MTCRCPACGHESETSYRCDECSHDLAKTDSSSSGDRAVVGGGA